MTSPLASFDIHNYQFNEVRQIELIEDLAEKHLEFVKREWSARLKDSWARAVVAFKSLPPTKQSEEAWQETQGKFGAPDSHWDWDEKHKSMLGSVHRMFALLDGEAVEGLMRIDLSKGSRIQSKPFTPIVYVDYLAVAPWNRPAIQTQPRYRGFGKLLLGIAVSISIEEGMDGRCGLHSLKQSEGFYRHAGMDDLGVDAAYGLRYFEFSPKAASKFLEAKQ